MHVFCDHYVLLECGKIACLSLHLGPSCANGVEWNGWSGLLLWLLCLVPCSLLLVPLWGCEMRTSADRCRLAFPLGTHLLQAVSPPFISLPALQPVQAYPPKVRGGSEFRNLRREGDHDDDDDNIM